MNLMLNLHEQPVISKGGVMQQRKIDSRKLLLSRNILWSNSQIIRSPLRSQSSWEELIVDISQEHSMKNFQKHPTMSLKLART